MTYVAPTATDNLDGPLSRFPCLPASGSLFALGSTTVNCSAANDGRPTPPIPPFAVVVRDSDEARRSTRAHADEIAEATGAAGANVTYVTPAASDNLDGPVPVSCLPASGSLFALGSTTVTCSANDAAGNTASSSFTSLVRDTTSPTISAHADVTAEASGPSGATVTYTPPTATDAVDGAVSVNCLPASGSLFAIGSTQVTCSAHDAAGNVSGSNFTILVSNSTPPTIAAHGNLSAEATSGAGATVTYTAPTATDAVDGSDSVNCLPASGSVFALGSTTVNCSATDAAGNHASSSFAVVVQDTTSPTIAAHGDLSAEATSGAGATVTYTAPTATDAVDGSDSVNCLPASGGVFALGSTIVNCSATDAAGNHASSSFAVVVQDTTPPDLQIPGAMSVVPTDPAGAIVTYAATATDLVDGAVSVSCSPDSGTQFPLGVTDVSCSASDAAGNVATASFSVWVGNGAPPPDTTPPTIAAHSNLTVEATGSERRDPVTYTSADRQRCGRRARPGQLPPGRGWRLRARHDDRHLQRPRRRWQQLVQQLHDPRPRHHPTDDRRARQPNGRSHGRNRRHRHLHRAGRHRHRRRDRRRHLPPRASSRPLRARHHHRHLHKPRRRRQQLVQLDLHRPRPRHPHAAERSPRTQL